MPRVLEEDIDTIRQIAATLLRRSPDIPVQRSVEHLGPPPQFFASMLLSNEESTDSDVEGGFQSMLRKNRGRTLETIQDPRPGLALIFENLEIFNSVSNRPALIQVIQQDRADLPAIETEVDLHVLSPYDGDCFKQRDSSRAVRIAEREYRCYRAHAVFALAEAIRRYRERITNYRTHLGRNIDRLRKECGWSFDVLADKSGLDRKLVLRHVNQGKGAHPKTLKRYAKAFSTELNREVSVEELQS